MMTFGIPRFLVNSFVLRAPSLLLGRLFSLRNRLSIASLLSLLVLMSFWSAGFAGAAAATPDETATGYRQLVILFDPERDDSPVVDEILAAVLDTHRNPGLYEALSRPVGANRVLNDTSPELRSDLARDPTSPRSLLENYVVLTYSNVAEAEIALVALERDPRVLSVELNAPLTFSATPTDRYFAQDVSQPAAGNYQWGMQLLNFPQAWSKNLSVNNVYLCWHAPEADDGSGEHGQR